MAKRSFYQLVWRELHWQRPYTQEQVCDILSHLASTIPRGAIIWEARGHGGYVKHIIGADAVYIRRIESVMKAHGDIRFYPLEDYHRAPVSAARQLVISHTGLSLSTDAISSTIRAGLAALAAVRGEDESVMQIVLGKSFRPQPTPKHIYQRECPLGATEKHERWKSISALQALSRLQKRSRWLSGNR